MSDEERAEQERQIEHSKRDAESFASMEREKKGKEYEEGKRAREQLRIRGTAAGTGDIRTKMTANSTAVGIPAGQGGDDRWHNTHAQACDWWRCQEQQGQSEPQQA